MSEKLFRHYISTCYNLNLYANGGASGFDADGWMAHRLRLFSTFTIPSLKNQSCQDFIYNIFLDDDTPPRHREQIEELLTDNMRCIYLSGVRGCPLIAEYTRTWHDKDTAKLVAGHNVGQNDTNVITSRIDNDDALGKDFVKTVQENYNPGKLPSFINFHHGYLVNVIDKTIYLMTYVSNNTPSLMEKAWQIRTVHCKQHGNVYQAVPARNRVGITDGPYWLLVVHGHNVANTARPAQVSKKIDWDRPAGKEIFADFGVNENCLDDWSV